MPKSWDNLLICLCVILGAVPRTMDAGGDGTAEQRFPHWGPSCHALFSPIARSGTPLGTDTALRGSPWG
jgi:hypothetical protein